MFCASGPRKIKKKGCCRDNNPQDDSNVSQRLLFLLPGMFDLLFQVYDGLFHPFLQPTFDGFPQCLLFGGGALSL